jgi:hypothetical protein
MRTTQEFEDKDFGTFILNEYDKNKVGVWWDPYMEMEGFDFCDAQAVMEESDFYNEFINKANIKDFKDLPKKGEFKNLKEAKEYIESKFKIKLV